MQIARHMSALVSALALFSAWAAERPSFTSKPMLAGRASLTEDGFRVSRNLGTANATPELAYPIELTYESFSEKTGIFGWQFFSRVRWWDSRTAHLLCLYRGIYCLWQ